MTAVVVATASAEDGSPACLLTLGSDAILSHLCRQIVDHGMEDVLVLTRPEWVGLVRSVLDGPSLVSVTSLADTLDAIAEAAHDGTGPLLLCHGEIITHDSAIAGLLRNPRLASGVVAGGGIDKPAPRLRIDRGRVVAAESAYHSVNRSSTNFLGFLKVSGEDRVGLGTVAAELADICRDQMPPGWEAELAAKVEQWGVRFFRRSAPLSLLAAQIERAEGTEKWLPAPEAMRRELDQAFNADVLHPAAVTAEDVVSLVLTGLIRSGQILIRMPLRDLFWARPLSQFEADVARAEMDAIDEDRVLLNSAVKGADGFFTTFLVSPYSRYIARWCAQRGFTPNQVTWFSMLLGVLAAGSFALGNRIGLVIGALLLQFAFTFDCVDGQLARYTRQFSRLGAWLDSILDRGKEYIVFVGLAIGGAQMGSGAEIWTLAAAALALQTVRHAIAFSYSSSQHQAITAAPKAPITEPHESRAAAKRVLAARAGAVRGMETDDGQKTAAIPLSTIGRAGLKVSRFFERREWMQWAKRIFVLPIGERFALISITAALFEPRITFIALLVWGGIATLYLIAGRILRSLV